MVGWECGMWCLGGTLGWDGEGEKCGGCARADCAIWRCSVLVVRSCRCISSRHPHDLDLVLRRMTQREKRGDEVDASIFASGVY